MVNKSREIGTTGVATFQAVDGTPVCRGKGKKDILAGQYRRLVILLENAIRDKVFKKQMDNRVRR